MTQMQQAYGQMLAGYPWTFWLTGSLTLLRRSPDACIRAFRHYVNRIEQQCDVKAFYFAAVEVGRGGGRRHIHALIGGFAAVPHRFARDVWMLLYGHPTLEPYDPTRGASYYILKHVVGDFGDDYWMEGDWPVR